MTIGTVREIILPRTDAAAVVQAVVVLSFFALSLVAVRRDRELRLFITGCLVIAAGLLALRTLH